MSINLERRLKRIKENLNKKSLDLCDMSDDELAQVITGDPGAGAGDIANEELESMMRETSDDIRASITTP